MPPPAVPPLPAALADPRPVIAIGTAGWALALIVVAIRALSGRAGLGEELLTCVIGTALGALGYGIFFWQRRSTRRDAARGQRGLR